MHPDIERAVALIDHQIIELQRAKKVLLETFGEKNFLGSIETKSPSLFPTQIKGTRKDALIGILRERGPLTRGEIHKQTNIPLGTIAAALNDKKCFENRNGKWFLIKGDNDHVDAPLALGGEDQRKSR